MTEKQPTNEFLVKMIKQAGLSTLDYFQKNFVITEKSNNQGIVTEADFNSENLIKSLIHSSFEDHDILAEESGMTKYANSNQNFIPTWIIDPLDGTTNFSKGNPYYCISIAFGYCSQGRFAPQLASVYQPTTDSLYFAEKGKGAFYNDKQIFISQLKEFRSASITTGFSSNKGNSLVPLTKTILEIQNKSLGLRINGAAALDLANTARGITQGFYETPLAPWDTAAGALLITEAGGKVTNFEGNEYCPIQDRGIIASSPFLFDELFKTIKIHYS